MLLNCKLNKCPKNQIRETNFNQTWEPGSRKSVSFINMKWNSLSLLTNLGLKYTLSDIIITTLACSGGREY
jgi:hypothetical protein